MKPPDFLDGPVFKASGCHASQAEFSLWAPHVAFVSQWTNYPRQQTVSLREHKVQAGDVVWLLISASTFLRNK